ncbi:MAG: XdhC family protein [Planctomycetes bacterium]|nr:XdhC family protein [Planctomycetota bacterium]
MSHRTVDQLLIHTADLLDAGRQAALCLLYRTRGSTPANAGALMVIDDHAELAGTIGGGCIEAEVRKRAFALIGEGTDATFAFQLDHDYGWDDGLICGGQVDVLVWQARDPASLRRIAHECQSRQTTSLSMDVSAPDSPAEQQRFILHLPPRPRLLIAGAGHVGSALSRMAIAVDFDVCVFDDRADLLERFIADPAQRICGPIHETITDEPIDDETYIVIVTRGHKHDEQVLEAVASTAARYLGMIGSRRKVKLIFDDLIERGVPETTLQRVHAPIGIDINSVTVPEIAVSIVAELIAERRQHSTPPVQGPIDLSV